MKLENGEDDSGVDLSGGSCGGFLKKGPWTSAEDDLLRDYVKNYGEGNWNSVQKNTGLLRCGKSCRLRYTNHLRSDLKKGSLTADEERLILDLHSKLGNKWARMAAHLPGRTDNEIKNYWNTRIKRRQRAGLPVYPIGIHKQAGASHSHPRQHLHPHFSPAVWSRIPATSSYHPKQNEMSHVPMFDQINMSTPSSVPCLHQTNPFLNIPVHGFKRFGGNGIGFSFPFSPPHPPSLSPQQFTSHFSQPAMLQTPFEPDGLVLPGLAMPVKSELPSNQLPEPAANVAALGTPKDDDYKTYMQLAETNSGLLDALVHEAQAMMGSQGNKCILDELLDCSFGATMKKEPIHELPNNVFESELNDFSALLDVIPSMPYPEWGYSDSGGTYNNLETQHMVSSPPPVPTAIDHDWSIAPWNNMPGIC